MILAPSESDDASFSSFISPLELLVERIKFTRMALRFVLDSICQIGSQSYDSNSKCLSFRWKSSLPTDFPVLVVTQNFAKSLHGLGFVPSSSKGEKWSELFRSDLTIENY